MNRINTLKLFVFIFCLFNMCVIIKMKDKADITF